MALPCFCHACCTYAVQIFFCRLIWHDALARESAHANSCQAVWLVLGFTRVMPAQVAGRKSFDSIKQATDQSSPCMMLIVQETCNVCVPHLR